MSVDRFGNPHAPELPYARSNILADTEDDFRKLHVDPRERGDDDRLGLSGISAINRR